MTNVVQLETAAKAANRHTIEILEKTLAQAKEGKVQEVALALVYNDQSTGWRRSSTESISSLIGSASILIHNLHLTADELARDAG